MGAVTYVSATRCTQRKQSRTIFGGAKHIISSPCNKATSPQKQAVKSWLKLRQSFISLREQPLFVPTLTEAEPGTACPRLSHNYFSQRAIQYHNY
ncbi:hypothetical protein E2C01_039177 [Portunus trituberculatus]|uniref:Uncharacterized protein n=1 Tax=Portunus trituberculatus TaxID=210409 RepID=A0A5B7FKN4_PORTR|nr:hypothetical protein [Portunus trituberculatus]